MVNGTRVSLTRHEFNELFKGKIKRPEHLVEVDGVVEMIEHMDGYERIVRKEILSRM